MKLNGKLLKIQQEVDKFVKNAESSSLKYSYVSSDAVLGIIRPKMNELSLLLEPSIVSAITNIGTSKSGTDRIFTELNMFWEWIDAETDESKKIPWYAQGIDLAGEKGVGKALTYAEKYFLLKYFHVPTVKDDPDNDKRTKSGALKQAGTQAAKETADYHRAAIMQMVGILCDGDAEKIKKTLAAFTKNPARQFDGFDDINKISAAALPVVYAKAKETFKKKRGTDFVYTQETAQEAAEE